MFVPRAKINVFENSKKNSFTLRETPSKTSLSLVFIGNCDTTLKLKINIFLTFLHFCSGPSTQGCIQKMFILAFGSLAYLAKKASLAFDKMDFFGTLVHCARQKMEFLHKVGVLFHCGI